MKRKLAMAPRPYTIQRYFSTAFLQVSRGWRRKGISAREMLSPVIEKTNNMRTAYHAARPASLQRLARLRMRYVTTMELSNDMMGLEHQGHHFYSELVEESAQGIRFWEINAKARLLPNIMDRQFNTNAWLTR